MADMSPHALLVTALKNTHAMAAESKTVCDHQLKRFDHYPEVKAFLDTRSQTLATQRARLDTVLQTMSEKTSAFKELVTSTVGTAAMLGHGATGDEVLKDYFVDAAFAGMAVTCYDSLFAIAQAVGEPDVVSALKASREEEERDYDWLVSHVTATTQSYVSLAASGQTSSH